MVDDAAHFLPGGLGRADVHAPVELHGIAGDDLPAKAFGQRYRQGGLSRGRRADDTDDPVHPLKSS